MTGSCSDGDLQDEWTGSQAIDHLLMDGFEISAFTVHFVDKRQPGHLVAVCLSPNGFALCFHAFAGTEDDSCSVQNSQTPLDFSGEIDMSGRI